VLETQDPSQTSTYQQVIAVLVSIVATLGAWIAKIKRDNQRGGTSPSDVRRLIREDREQEERWRELDRRLEYLERHLGAK
jgi:hypothetical protein